MQWIVVVEWLLCTHRLPMNTTPSVAILRYLVVLWLLCGFVVPVLAHAPWAAEMKPAN